MFVSDFSGARLRGRAYERRPVGASAHSVAALRSLISRWGFVGEQRRVPVGTFCVAAGLCKTPTGQGMRSVQSAASSYWTQKHNQLSFRLGPRFPHSDMRWQLQHSKTPPRSCRCPSRTRTWIPERKISGWLECQRGAGSHGHVLVLVFVFVFVAERASWVRWRKGPAGSPWRSG